MRGNPYDSSGRDIEHEPLNANELLNRAGVFDAASLMRREFAPLKFVVPGMLAEGFTLLAGAPKAGKSWLALDLALGLASGKTVFGSIELGDPRPVLLLALEDGPRRLRDRILALGYDDAPHRLNFVTATNGVPIRDLVAAWMTEFGETSPVVVLDTIGRARPAPLPGSSAYADDYAFGAGLKLLTDNVPGSALIALHHTRKAGSEDFLDAVSGTQGLAGAADGVAVLRRPRLGDEGTLAVTSRDAAEGEFALAWNEGRWRLDGRDLHEASSRAQERRSTDNLGERSTDVVGFVNANPTGVRPQEAASSLGLDSKTAGTYLGRAAESGRIRRIGRGLYGPVGSVESEESDAVS